MTTFRTGAATIPRPAWGAVETAGPRLWRVRDRGGLVLGHIRAVADGGESGVRYRAERFQPLLHAFRTVGEFASSREAMECLRG